MVPCARWTGTDGLSGVTFPPTDTTEAFLSEFYTLRRRAIKDITGLIAFVIGWFASAPVGWPYITAGFENGEVTKGVAQFLVAVFGGACVSGLAGLALGTIGGWVWERAHRALRSRRPVVERAASPVAAGARASGTPAPATLPPLPPLRYDEDALAVDDYIALAQRIAPGDYNTRKTAAALERTINICAWDGTRLVGVARVLSDGYTFAALADLFVDPDYRRRGVGRELMNRAFNRTPRGSLFAGAPTASVPFFDRLGCERGPAGFTMHRAATTRPGSTGGQKPA